eukprot:3002646-Rhodomonas_salina.1
MDAMRQLTFVLLLAFTATFGPSMIVWVAVGAYLGSCNHRCRVSQQHINETYFPPTPDPSANFKQVYTFKQILVAAARADDERIYVDSGCAISIFRARELMVNLQEIKPIVVQGIAGERTINMAGDLHLQAVSNDGIARTIIVNGVLFDQESPVNLLLADQLRQRGFSVRLEPDDTQCCIVLNQHNDPSSTVVYSIKEMAPYRKSPSANSCLRKKKEKKGERERKGEL